MLLVKQKKARLFTAGHYVNRIVNYFRFRSGGRYLAALDADPSQVARQMLQAIQETPEGLGWEPYPYAEQVPSRGQAGGE